MSCVAGSGLAREVTSVVSELAILVVTDCDSG